MRWHISTAKLLVKFRDMNGTTMLCLCTEITVTNMNRFTVLCKGTEIMPNITDGHYLTAQCLIKTAMWDWRLSYWNFREIALQNKSSTKTSYKVSQIPYSPVPNILIESQNFQQQNLAPTQNNSPQNTVSVWLQEINDLLSNLIIKKKWEFLCKS
jgi:hypothetical protein